MMQLFVRIFGQFLPAWLLGMLLVVGLAWADDAPYVVPPVELMVPASSFDNISNVTTMTQQQILSAGAQTVADVLQGQPGLMVDDLYGDGSHVMLNMRGFGTNAASNSLVLVDGLPLRNPDEAPADLSTIDLQDISRVDIVPASAAVRYGDQAVGGIVNIITKPTTKPSGYVSTRIGSHDLQDYRAGYSNLGQHGLSYRVSGDYKTDNNERDADSLTYGHLLGRVDEHYAGGHVYGQYQFTKDKQELPGALTQAQLDQDRDQAQPGSDAFSHTYTSDYRVGWEQAMTESWHWNTQLDHSKMHASGEFGGQTLFSKESYTTPWRQSRETTQLSPVLKGVTPVKNGLMLTTVGVDGSYDKYQFETSLLSKDRRRQGGVFGQLDYPVTRRLHAHVGARMAGNQDELTGVGTQHNQAAVTEEGISYAFSKSMRGFLRRAGSYRFAKADEEINIDNKGNPEVNPLNPQTGVSYETGLNYKKPAFNASVTLFHLDLHDEIAYAPTAQDSNLYNNTNLDPTKRTGFILQNALQLTSFWDIQGQYTYVHARFASGQFEGNSIPFVAENSYALRSHIRFLNHWQAYLEDVYTGSRYPSGDDANVASKEPSYSVLNSNVSYTLKKWVVSLRVNNILDKAYNSEATFTPIGPTQLTKGLTTFYPAEGRNMMLTVRYQL